MILAHIAGFPVEETLQPVLIAVLLSGAWLTARLRQPRRSRVEQRRRSWTPRTCLRTTSPQSAESSTHLSPSEATAR
jgi:hypothetical protein